MHMLFGAQSGWGKSLHFQSYAEQNIGASNYDAGIILDYSDEYRGLVKAGYASHWICGERELSWSRSDWRAFIQANPQVVLARVEDLSPHRWRELCATVVGAIRSMHNAQAFLAIDEAHFVAPERQLPESVGELATTGRGAGDSAVFITQRLAKIANDVITQCQAAMLGGFDGSLSRLSEAIEYPPEAHKPGGKRVPGLPESLHTELGESISVRKFEEDGQITGSEWIYSDDSGERTRIDTTGLADRMESEHIGQEGNPIHRPDY